MRVVLIYRPVRYGPKLNEHLPGDPSSVVEATKMTLICDALPNVCFLVMILNL